MTKIGSSSGQEPYSLPGTQPRPSGGTSSPKAHTLGRKYFEGDTKEKMFYMVPNEEKESWDIGFDKIDISPKDGTLSRDEICDYREKQTPSEVSAYLALFFNPILKPVFKFDGKNFYDKIYEAKSDTKYFRNLK